jgi:hypothetical protein
VGPHRASLTLFLLFFILLVAADIRLFLSSRYGIIVTENEVRDLILGGLGGGGDSLEGDGGFFDLMEVVACLLIPTLLKAAHQQNGITPLPANTVPANEKMLGTVWKIMLHDVSFWFIWRLRFSITSSLTLLERCRPLAAVNRNF